MEEPFKRESSLEVERDPTRRLKKYQDMLSDPQRAMAANLFRVPYPLVTSEQIEFVRSYHVKLSQGASQKSVYDVSTRVAATRTRPQKRKER